MAEYYLISQLPSLDGLSEDASVSITEEYFLELCSRILNKKAFEELEKLTLIPSLESEKSYSPLVEKWNEHEKNLRLALGKVRAEKMNKPFDLQNKALSNEIYKTANAATEIKNPLDAEKFLLSYRLNFLETLRPIEPFSEEFIFYYGLKLKLILRIRQFDTGIGETTYKNIYNSILNGDSLEA